MIEVDPGHIYGCHQLDGRGYQLIRFVKREGPGYPGNVGKYSGTNIQELLRAIIARLKYLQRQGPHFANVLVIAALRLSLNLLEYRAARRHRNFSVPSDMRRADSSSVSPDSRKYAWAIPWPTFTFTSSNRLQKRRR